ncbi:MAG: hypothetical protein V1729_00440 [Candidatus Woesearchaeota archaeon]
MTRIWPLPMDLRYVSRSERKMREQKKTAEILLAEARRALGESPDGTPELQMGEVLLVPVPDTGFMDKHINSTYNLRGGDVSDITRESFEQLMRCVGRREPFTDPRAKDSYIDLKRSAELQGRNPEDVEKEAIALFTGNMSQIIGGTSDFDEFMLKFRLQVEMWGQELPFKIQNIFFNNTRHSPNFPKMIYDKFGVDAEKEIAAYIIANTNSPVFEDIRMVTLDRRGIMTDMVVSKDAPYVEFHAAHYLAASKHYVRENSNKPKKALRKQTDLERRIVNAEFREEDIVLGVTEYISRLLESPSYRATIAVDDTADGKGVTIKEIGADLFATVIAFDSSFSNSIWKVNEQYKKSGAKVGWVKDFRFPYR